MSLIRNLCRNYGDFKIEIQEWEISDSGITALWGPSGSGKTSVFRLLIGLEECPGLVWKFKGEDLAQLPVPERRLGVVFQSLELFPHMTARENILFAFRARRVLQEERDPYMERLVSALKLTPFLDRRARLLSGGEQQRVAIARALAGKPRFLFLDEPFSSLDAELRGEARQLVKSVIEEFSVPTLLITHDKEDVDALGAHLVRIENGCLLANASFTAPLP